MCGVYEGVVRIYTCVLYEGVDDTLRSVEIVMYRVCACVSNGASAVPVRSQHQRVPICSCVCSQEPGRRHRTGLGSPVAVSVSVSVFSDLPLLCITN